MPRSRSFRTQLVQLLDSASVPVYFLDERRRIVFCNTACAAWVGAPVDQIVGLRCDYHSKPEADRSQAIAAGLCPPPEAFAGRTTGLVAAATESGGSRRRMAEFVPLGRDVVQCVGLIAVLDDKDQTAETTPAPERQDEPALLHELVRAYREQARRHYQIDRLVGESQPIKRVRDQVAAAVASGARVVLVGPKGTGREYVARTIHFGHQQATAASLIPLDCTLLDSELLQSTVSAYVRRWAELQPEQPAALLLLEVDQLAPDAQRDLVGFLDIHECPLRTIATAGQSLLQLAEQDRFRRDLAFALSTLVIELPGLTQRSEDVPVLAQLLLEDLNAVGKRQLGGFSPAAMDRLVAYPWPGNLDELVSTVAAVHQQADGPLVEPEDLPERLALAAEALEHPPHEPETISLDSFLQDIERELIARALRQSKGNKAQAARWLGISRARLLRRATQVGADRP